MVQTQYRIRIEACLIFIGALFLFLWQLPGQEIIGFESRFYVFALEMWHRGISWFPTVYHQPYPDYPVTSTLLIYLLAKAVGGLNKTVAVFPTACVAALTVMLTYLIGALQERRWGWYGVFFLLFTITFFQSARLVGLDMYPTAITAACFYFVESAHLQKKSVNWFLIYFLLVLGFAFRGPIGLVMPTSVLCMYYVVEKDIKRSFIVGCTALLLLCLLTSLLLFMANQAGGTAFVKDVLRMEVIGRIEKGSLPWYFYFASGLTQYALSFPLAIGSVFSIIYYWRKKQVMPASFLLKLIAWLSIIVVGMSIPDTKKIRYILPMVPAAALLSSYIFVAPANQTFFAFLRRCLLGLFFILPSLLIIALISFIYIVQKQALGLPMPNGVLIDTLFVLQLVVILLRRVRIGVFAVTLLSFLLMMYGVSEPVVNYLEQSHDFVSRVEAQRVALRAHLVFYKEKPDNLPIKYRAQMSIDEQPLFVEDWGTLSRLRGSFYVITSEHYFSDLPATQVTVLMRGKLGHVPVVVFVPSAN
ncbi:MAG TPA: glycosyltransferase family 39 protein [Gammaproteobacteria bacterium]|jgi:4-amino-4-deoxy-L-arabinose transferase-like glycosyltransferase|nr:glycosyltransferase family 39 protein [Gammaproteobacteria bacterium]